MDELKASEAPVITVTQTTRLLSDIEGRTLDERTVRRACEAGQLPCVRVGRRMLVVREKLLAMITSDQASPGAPPAA
jgi:hypothetical protein